MIQETKYIALDGTKFSTEAECLAHETEYRKRQEKQWDFRMKLYCILKDEYREKTEKCKHCDNGRVQTGWGFGGDGELVNCEKCNGLGYKTLPDSYPQDLVTRPLEVPEDLRTVMKAAWDQYWKNKNE